MGRRGRTPAERYLGIVIRLLPPARRYWGRAMQAELAALDTPAERWRFALSCTRVVLLPAARVPRLARTGLVAGVLAGFASGTAAFLVLPFERIGEPLGAGLPWRGTWLALIVFGAPAAAALVTARRTGHADEAVMAALCAGALAALLVAALGLAAIGLFPDHVPDIVGPVMVPGTPLSEQRAANAIEASDPYFGLLMFGGMLAALLCVMARPPVRASTTVGLLCLFAVPPLVLAGTAQDFPGSRAITTATLALVIGAIATARPAPAPSSQLDEPALT